MGQRRFAEIRLISEERNPPAIMKSAFSLKTHKGRKWRRRHMRRSRVSSAVCFPAGGESREKMPASHLKLNEGRSCRLLNESTHLAH